MNVCIKGDNIFISSLEAKKKILPGKKLTSVQIIIMRLLLFCSLKAYFYFA